MTLTKHLYKLDEVRAALLLCLKNRRHKEALFWLNELEESCYSGEARRLLFVAWTMFVGITNLSWLHAWSQQGHTREGRRKLCWQLMFIKQRDSSLWWILLYPVSGHVSVLFEQWKTLAKEEEETFWQTLVDSSTDERIDAILESLQTDMKSYSIYAKCASFCILRSGLKLVWGILTEKEPEIEMENSSEMSLRNARLYEIPYDCLFGMTGRGGGYDSLAELRSLSRADLLKSPYWKKVLANYTDASGSWKSDEDLEAFWDTHFPCDIPDEWSLKDQKKSHGPGSTCFAAPLSRWWKNWMPLEKGVDCKGVQEWLDKTPASVSIFDRILQIYRQ
jgi:hypothetical protein